MAKDLRVKLGAAIRDSRLKAGLSQAEVGKLTRKGQPYQSEIELGNVNLTLDTLLLVAAAVGLEIDVVTRPAQPSIKPSSPEFCPPPQSKPPVSFDLR